MTVYFHSLSLLIAVLFISCKGQNDQSTIGHKESTIFQINNPTKQNWINHTIHLSLDQITSSIKETNWNKVKFTIDEDVPFQFLDRDKNGIPEGVLLLVSLKANQNQNVQLNYLNEDYKSTFKKRTQAEISHKINGKWEGQKYIGGDFKNINKLIVPKEHTDHSEFIRYEGPGWESDKVGYRFYLDWRNAIDIFGKKTSEPVLQKIGQDGFDSYHNEQDWGMDILKVGSSLGIGSIGFWEDGKAIRIEKTDSLKCKIEENGILQSEIETTYWGWKINNKTIDLVSNLTIQAGSRMTRQDITISKSLPNICTGIVKHKDAKVIQKSPTDSSNWSYLATFGKQTTNSENLGMAIFFKNSDLKELQQDQASHVIVLSPSDNELTYYFAAAWEQEENGIKDIESFRNYLDNKILEFNSIH